MNLSLLDPFALAQEFPDTLTHSFVWGHSACIKFNRKGDYLASGLLDGTIVIFDYETYGAILVLRGHTRPIQSISWSRDGRYLLSSSRDWKCILWDLSTGEAEKTINLGAPVWNASLHPENHSIFVASLYEDHPRYVDLSNDSPVVKVLPTVDDATTSNTTTTTAKSEEPDEPDDTIEPQPQPHSRSKAGKQVTLVAEFSKKGDFILSGTNKGTLNIIRTDNLKLERSFKVSSSNIKQIRISSSGRSIVVNASDRAIRLLSCPDLSRSDPTSWDLELEHKFHDVVNRPQWNSIAMSGSGEYVLATTYESAHDIYMWETSMGSLVKIYEGPKEELVDIEFHPTKPAVAATGLDTGAVYLWTYSIPQKWSALAPDFVELEENIEYEEREDEFDLVDEAAQTKRQLDEEEEDVDVITIERNRGEYTEDSFVIPISLGTIEDPPDSDDDD